MTADFDNDGFDDDGAGVPDAGADASGAAPESGDFSSAALLAAIVEGSDDAIVAKDLDSKVLSWNAGAERLFGWTAQEMIGQSIRLLIPAERQAEEDAILRQIQQGRQVSAFHTVRLRKTGAEVRVSVTVSPIRDASGKIIGASKIARDVGALERAREKLAESEQRFKMMADNISQLAWIADAEGNLFWYNKRWFDYTGTTLEEMQGWGWTRVHHPDHVDRVVERIQHSWDSGEPWEDTFPLRGRDGNYRWYLSRARPIRDEEGRIVNWFGTNTDVTEQRAQAESIETLLQEVNHRSKNMLTLIQALARRSAPGDDAFLKRFTRRLEALSANQDLLVRRAWTSVDFEELVRAQLSYAFDIAESRIVLDGPPFQIGARAAETIGMALHELATNALKYGALSVDGGQVSVCWGKDGERFVVDWRESGGPAVAAPDHAGFGTAVIRDFPRTALDAETALDFAEGGAHWHFSAPVAGLSAHRG